jgi:hypothetical protein
MIPIYDNIPHAQATVLRRAAWDEQQMPASVLDGVERIFGQRLTPEQAVATVLADVRARGDAAVLEWSQRIDGPPARGSGSAADRTSLAVPQAEIDAAAASLDPALLDALTLASQRLEAFHRQQPVGSWMDVTPGGVLGQIVRPLRAGGRLRARRQRAAAVVAAHVAIPAQVAGVAEIVVVHAARARWPRAAGHPGRGRGGGLTTIYTSAARRPSAPWPMARERAARGQDRWAGQPLRHPGQAAGVRAGGHRWAAWAHRDPRHRRRHGRIRPGWPPTCWPRPSTTCWRRPFC